MARRRGAMSHDGPRSGSHASMKAHNLMTHPPGGWMLPPFPCGRGQRRVRPRKCLTHAGLQGRIPQHTHGPDQQEGHAPRRCVEGARGGHTRGLVHDAHPALPRRLAGVACQPLWRWPHGGCRVRSPQRHRRSPRPGRRHHRCVVEGARGATCAGRWADGGRLGAPAST